MTDAALRAVGSSGLRSAILSLPVHRPHCFCRIPRAGLSRLVYFFLRNRGLAGLWAFRCGDFIRTAGAKLAYRGYLSILLLVVTDMDDTRGGVRTSDAPVAQLVLLGE